MIMCQSNQQNELSPQWINDRRLSITSESSRTIPIDDIKPIPPVETKKQKTKRRVIFHGDVSVRLIPSVDDYSQSSLKEMYYSQREYRYIKTRKQHEAEQLSKSIRMSTCCHDKLSLLYCVRGIEHDVYPTMRQKKIETRLRARRSLFEEQDYQYDTGSFNNNILAAAYSTCTKDAAEQAARIAQNDMAEANKIYADV